MVFSDLNFDYLQKGTDSVVYAKLTVKFYTTDAKVFTQSFFSFYNVGFIKRNLGEIFNCPKSVIDLLHREEPIPDETRLSQFKPDKYGILEFKLQSKDRNFKIPIENAYKDLIVPDILTVRVEKDNEVKDVVVEIDNKAIEKPFIGGFRDIQTGVQYHHGYTQTGLPPSKVPPERKNHRDTNTVFTRNRRTEKEYSRATQVSTNNLYIPNSCDKILTAGPYETADEREQRLDVEGKVRTIQRYFRAWVMRKRLKDLSEEYQKRMRLELEREERERQESNERRKKDLVSKVFPMKPGDFAMLYTMVERWKKSELDRITSMSCGAAKIAEFYLLLEKEIEILQSIDRLRMKVKKDLELKKIIDFFKAIGSPIEWDSKYKHIHISMDTLEAQKGREYFELYQRICNKHISKEERIETYSAIKDYLTTHRCAESQEIMSLIDRVCEILARGMMEPNYLTGLQKRIEALLLHHFKIEECNEGVTDHMKKIKLKHMNKNLIFCPSCQKLKPIESFTIHARYKKCNVSICAQGGRPSRLSCKFVSAGSPMPIDRQRVRNIWEKFVCACPATQHFGIRHGTTGTAGRNQYEIIGNQIRLEKMKTCTTCKWLDKAEEPWIDLSPHKFILRQIRNYERLHHGTSSIAFILQDRDIHFIITFIWHSHSALSECNDIYQLRLVRWKKDEEWSPWNCILLTLDEAKAHLRVLELKEVYEEEFINHVFNKHALARVHFRNLTSYDRHFTEFAKGDPRLDEHSEFYNNPDKHECDIELDSDSGSDENDQPLEKLEDCGGNPQQVEKFEYSNSNSDESEQSTENAENTQVLNKHTNQDIEEQDKIIYKRIYEDKDSEDSEYGCL